MNYNFEDNSLSRKFYKYNEKDYPNGYKTP